MLILVAVPKLTRVPLSASDMDFQSQTLKALLLYKKMTDVSMT